LALLHPIVLSSQSDSDFERLNDALRKPTDWLQIKEIARQATGQVKELWGRLTGDNLNSIVGSSDPDVLPGRPKEATKAPARKTATRTPAPKGAGKKGAAKKTAPRKAVTKKAVRKGAAKKMAAKNANSKTTNAGDPFGGGWNFPRENSRPRCEEDRQENDGPEEGRCKKSDSQTGDAAEASEAGSRAWPPAHRRQSRPFG
jgi:hypothetical protein